MVSGEHSIMKIFYCSQTFYLDLFSTSTNDKTLLFILSNKMSANKKQSTLFKFGFSKVITHRDQVDIDSGKNSPHFTTVKGTISCSEWPRKFKSRQARADNA